jgi:hypothetical protein
VLINQDNTIAGGGDFATMTLINSGTIAATYADNALTLATGKAIVNDGTLEANGGNLIVDDAVTGTGVALVTGGGGLIFNADVAENVISLMAASYRDSAATIRSI